MLRYRAGEYVMDVPRGLVGRVEEIEGDLLTLIGPRGVEWEQELAQCRPASPDENASFRNGSTGRRVESSTSGLPRWS
ncbi:hypothetical protein [Streptomyces jumonjinensis]|uniref:hypothetical protein n=1 Tax=Streptomyces jumonjinensis TaxID=1945 RepID=UPI0037963F9F